QKPQPPGLLDGQESRNGVVLSNPPGVDIIPVTVVNGSAPNNDFGELVPPSLSGFVYVDNNNNGIKESGEAPIPGATITLTGTDTAGPVPQTATTDAAGFYQFVNLQAGTYALNETQPAGYLDGKDTIGSQGG